MSRMAGWANNQMLQLCGYDMQHWRPEWLASEWEPWFFTVSLYSILHCRERRGNARIIAWLGAQKEETECPASDGLRGGDVRRSTNGSCLDQWLAECSCRGAL
jgi:hypothetical protein